MKKLLCLILSAVLLALTGCGAAEPPAAETPAETAAPAGNAAALLFLQKSANWVLTLPMPNGIVT